jgi:hypothetical protein
MNRRSFLIGVGAAAIAPTLPNFTLSPDILNPELVTKTAIKKRYISMSSGGRRLLLSGGDWTWDGKSWNPWRPGDIIKHMDFTWLHENKSPLFEEIKNVHKVHRVWYSKVMPNRHLKEISEQEALMPEDYNWILMNRHSC